MRTWIICFFVGLFSFTSVAFAQISSEISTKPKFSSKFIETATTIEVTVDGLNPRDEYWVVLYDPQTQRGQNGDYYEYKTIHRSGGSIGTQVSKSVTFKNVPAKSLTVFVMPTIRGSKPYDTLLIRGNSAQLKIERPKIDSTTLSEDGTVSISLIGLDPRERYWVVLFDPDEQKGRSGDYIAYRTIQSTKENPEAGPTAQVTFQDPGSPALAVQLLLAKRDSPTLSRRQFRFVSPEVKSARRQMEQLCLSHGGPANTGSCLRAMLRSDQLQGNAWNGSAFAPVIASLVASPFDAVKCDTLRKPLIELIEQAQQRTKRIFRQPSIAQLKHPKRCDTVQKVFTELLKVDLPAEECLSWDRKKPNTLACFNALEERARNGDYQKAFVDFLTLFADKDDVLSINGAKLDQFLAETPAADLQRFEGFVRDVADHCLSFDIASETVPLLSVVPSYIQYLPPLERDNLLSTPTLKKRTCSELLRFARERELVGEQEIVAWNARTEKDLGIARAEAKRQRELEAARKVAQRLASARAQVRTHLEIRVPSNSQGMRDGVDESEISRFAREADRLSKQMLARGGRTGLHYDPQQLSPDERAALALTVAKLMYLDHVEGFERALYLDGNGVNVQHAVDVVEKFGLGATPEQFHSMSEVDRPPSKRAIARSFGRALMIELCTPSAMKRNSETGFGKLAGAAGDIKRSGSSCTISDKNTLAFGNSMTFSVGQIFGNECKGQNGKYTCRFQYNMNCHANGASGGLGLFSAAVCTPFRTARQPAIAVFNRMKDVGWRTTEFELSQR